MSMQDPQSTSSSQNANWSGTTGQTGSTDYSGIQDTGVKAQQKTSELIDQAQEKVGDVAEKVKEQATSQVSSQKDRAAEGLDNVAQAVRQTGDQLRQKDQAAPVAQYTDQLAKGIESVSNFLKSRSVSDIFGEVENFARREPALFLGGALTIGLLGGRFLRSSGSSSSSSSQYRSNTALARPMNTSGYGGTYGSRSTGYSSGLSTDTVPGYSSYDLSGSTSGATSGDNYADATGSYTDSTVSGLDDQGLGSDSSGSTGSGYGSDTSDYNGGTSSGTSYGSNTSGYDTSYGTDRSRRSSTGSGGPLGGV